MIKAYLASIEDVQIAYSNSKDIYGKIPSLLEDAKQEIPKGTAIALYAEDGSLGAVMGVNVLQKGLAYGWAITTAQLDRYAVAYTRATKKLIADTMQRLSLSVLYITVLDEYSTGHRWAEVLGFRNTGEKMTAFGHEYALYSRRIEWTR